MTVSEERNAMRVRRSLTGLSVFVMVIAVTLGCYAQIF
jgi:hypothetical protein